MARIVILGAGVMGSAMAVPLGHAGHRVALVGTPLDEAIVAAVAAGEAHPGLKVVLGAHVAAHPWTAFPAVMAEPPDLVVLGVSSAGVTWAVGQLAAVLRQPLPVLIITKGLVGDGARIEVIPALIARELGRLTGLTVPLMAVGGPCIAAELAAGRDTSVVFTGQDGAPVAPTAALFAAPGYHIKISSDVVGVEVCAAFKNYFALGVGAAASFAERVGPAANGAAAHNVVATIFNRAVAEMAILAERLGGVRETAYGLAGVGDLHVTCAAGRNSRMGRLLGQGLPFSRAKTEKMPSDTVEGAQLALALGPTLEAMFAAGHLPAAELPLTRAIAATVCRDAPLEVTAAALLTL